MRAQLGHWSKSSPRIIFWNIIGGSRMLHWLQVQSVA
jgi:hypothetical protein